MTKVIAFYIYVGSVLVSQPMEAQNNVVLDTVYFYDISYKGMYGISTYKFNGQIYSDSTIVFFPQKDSAIIYAKSRKTNKNFRGAMLTSVEGVRVIYNTHQNQVLKIKGNYNHWVKGKSLRTNLIDFTINLDSVKKGSKCIMDFDFKENLLKGFLLNRVYLNYSNHSIHRMLKRKRMREKIQNTLEINTTWEYNYVTGQLKRINE